MNLIIGIDVGARGALALLSATGTLHEIADMPVLHDGPKGRRTVNAPLLADLVYRWQARQAYVETVGPRPEEGAVGAFAFGRCRGVIEGVLAACGVPCVHITAASWKRIMGLSLASKDASRSKVIQLFPSQADWFKRKCDDGRAEAVLIGLAGLTRNKIPQIEMPELTVAE